jgi:hypothetical protein
MAHAAVLAFLAGVLIANGAPHFVKGITKERFPSLLGSGPLVNLFGGWVMYVLAAVLFETAHVGGHPAVATRSHRIRRPGDGNVPRDDRAFGRRE